MERKKLVRKAEPPSKRGIAWPRWTGFRGMTVRDWMQLLIVPLAPVVISFLFTRQQDEQAQKIEDQRTQQAQKIEDQRAQQAQKIEDQRAEAERKHPRRSWAESAAGVSGSVVVVGALIYTLGLFALWAPIARTYTHDFTTAWHQTFLVPRAVVAGLGVKQLVAFPLLAGILIFAIVYCSQSLGGKKWGSAISMGLIGALVLFYCTWRIATSTGPISHISVYYMSFFVALIVPAFSLLGRSIHRLIQHVYPTAVLLALTGFSFLILTYYYWGRLVSEQPSLGTFDIAVASLVDVALIVGAGTIIFVGAGVRAPDLTRSLTLGSSLWKRLQPFLLVLTIAFIAAFMLTVPSNPPLPTVEIDIKNKDKNTVGTLLTHSEGFWYVYPEIKDHPDSRLTAIPDDEVNTVWISKRAG